MRDSQVKGRMETKRLTGKAVVEEWMICREQLFQVQEERHTACE